MNTAEIKAFAFAINSLSPVMDIEQIIEDTARDYIGDGPNNKRLKTLIEEDDRGEYALITNIMGEKMIHLISNVIGNERKQELYQSALVINSLAFEYAKSMVYGHKYKTIYHFLSEAKAEIEHGAAVSH